MLEYPNIDPVAINIGPVAIHWYGLMYLVGFLGAYALARLRGPKQPKPWSSDEIMDLLFYVALGVVLGGRLGYVLFYNLGSYLDNPLSILKLWEGGMSFHGGLLGVALAVYLFGRRYNRQFLEIGDFIAPFVPIGLGAGRLGNFINGELWGRVTHVPWGMVFPHVGPLPRHPSQLYEFLLEGVMLFWLMWRFSSTSRPMGAVSGMFLVLYSVFRFIVELSRQPDPQYGYLAFGWVTMGQILSIPMLAIGIALVWWAKKKCNNI